MPQFNYAGELEDDELCYIKINDKMKQSKTPIISFSPVVLSVPGRHVDLEIKVSAPASGNNLPIILLSHGHGPSNFLSSYKGYGPIVDFFAAEGFVVIQPTHQNSRALGLPSSLPEAPLFWSSRATDMKYILDHLDIIISTVPGLTGRVDKVNVAAIGHSMGGHTVAMLAGMEVTDPSTGKIVNFTEPRIKALVLVGVSGGPEGFNGAARQHYPVLAAGNFGSMTSPALIVNGDQDKNLMFSDVDNWRADAYYQSPGPKDLLTVFGAEHIFGGISGYDARETSDENPERVAFVCESILAYIRSAFNPNDSSWEQAKKTLNGVQGALGSIESKL